MCVSVCVRPKELYSTLHLCVNNEHAGFRLSSKCFDERSGEGRIIVQCRVVSITVDFRRSVVCEGDVAAFSDVMAMTGCDAGRGSRTRAPLWMGVLVLGLFAAYVLVSERFVLNQNSFVCI